MQGSFKLWPFGTLLLAGVLFCTFPAQSAGIAGPNPADPVLDGGPAGPCDPARGGADYVPGTDVNGNPVPAADLDRGAAPVPIPQRLSIPLKTRKTRAPTYVEADGKKLDPLLNPAPACQRR